VTLKPWTKICKSWTKSD